MSSVQEKYIAAIEADQKVNPGTIDDLFKQLPPVKPDHLIGTWNGGFFDTGHPVATQLDDIKWIGKSFKTLEDVDPVIVDRDGERASWGQWGFASVREMVYGGTVSAAMIYDDRPIFDHFRLVNDNLLAGVMEGKGLGHTGSFYFYLKR
ncbi:unnamed protein product [Penicillium salamii]|uniref:GXWXG domain-containing protein n=1 Tax=Penicillium salamii TaxID=1612424 RepID=A0A9W4JF24_9EURO|nr:unnamed protein product [Penicillium salamii]CAG8375080.1 unnamed protein product [Penicillium salamii]CAG8380375.1 unnamed protein product [Penicillium salamii]CAG8394908.1 unnamed protein product [Penicillium salamii]